ncbi:hypothetical protein [Gilliamella sp. CG13]
MTNRDFVKMKIKDRFHPDYQLTNSEINFSFIGIFILILFGLLLF